jgi:signal transduction histidine kinase
VRPSVAGRFRRLGLQRRIMLYVTAGLAVTFGLVAFLGLGAIDQATQLVYADRLTMGYTTAGILERDFERLASDARETADELGIAAGATSGSAGRILAHLDQTTPYPFFSVSGIWVLAPDGRLLDGTGSPAASGTATTSGASIVRGLTGWYSVGRAAGPVAGAVPFAAVAVRLGETPSASAPVIVIHTLSRNSTADFVPTLAAGGSGANGGSTGAAASGGTGSPTGTPSPSPAATGSYHLEVVDPDGIAVLGIGADEHPGTLSPHYTAIRSLMATGGAAALLHEPKPGDTFPPHVMAVVPLPSSPFYVVLEQPIDVALALPLQLREQLLLLTGVGFVLALVFAWITTRRVVKPTEELTAAAERMAQGDLASPVDVDAQDEVGRLAESFEAMRQRLRAATEATERTNRELERRVSQRTARLGQLLRQTISAQEEERRRLARELHDETAQTLAALSIALDRARDGLAHDPSDALDRIGEARVIAARLLAETRRLIMGLRPAVLDDMGLLPAIRWYAEATLVDHGVEVRIEADPPPPRLPGHIEVALFRIVQEAITNVAKHADATHVTITVDFDAPYVTIGVEDDGRGFDVDQALGATGPDAESVGLIGMQERVRLLDGQLEIHSIEGSGTRVRVRAQVLEEVA